MIKEALLESVRMCMCCVDKVCCVDRVCLRASLHYTPGMSIECVVLVR